MKATKDVLKKMLNLLEKDFQFLVNLRDRWTDEREYENFNDYEKAVKAKMNYVDVINVGKGLMSISRKMDSLSNSK